MKPRFGLIICIPLLYAANDLVSATKTGQLLIQSQYRSVFSDILMKTILQFSRLKRETTYDFLLPTLIISSVKNDNESVSLEHNQYQRDVINELLKLFQRHFYQYIVMDQCNVATARDKFYKMQTIVLFVDGIEAFLYAIKSNQLILICLLIIRKTLFQIHFQLRQ